MNSRKIISNLISMPLFQSFKMKFYLLETGIVGCSGIIFHKTKSWNPQLILYIFLVYKSLVWTQFN